MKILFIHNRYQQFGGEDVAVKAEADLLLQRGHEVHILYFSNDAIKGTLLKVKSGIKAIYNKNAGTLVEQEIITRKPDVIHVHNFFFTASPAIFFAAERHKIPVVLTIHNYRLICANALLLRNGSPCEQCIHQTIPLSGIIHRCYRNSFIESSLVTAISSFHKLAGTWQKKVTAYITLTTFAKEKMVGSALKIPAGKMHTIPNFVPDRGTGMADDREGHFLFIGRIAEEKGIRILLAAFQQRPDLKIRIIGEGPLLEELQIKYRAAENIVFLGKKNQDEIIAQLKKCKALVFPSIWYEGLPYTILEAFSTGTPVISSNIGAMRQLIIPKHNGWHFEPADPQTIVTAIDEFSSVSDQRLYTNARTTYEQNFSPNHHYHMLMKLYNAISEPAIIDKQ